MAHRAGAKAWQRLIAGILPFAVAFTGVFSFKPPLGEQLGEGRLTAVGAIFAVYLVMVCVGAVAFRGNNNKSIAS